VYGKKTTFFLPGRSLLIFFKLWFFGDIDEVVVMMTF